MTEKPKAPIHAALQQKYVLPPEFQVVDSSNLFAVAHEKETLKVAFHSGSVYAYPDVPRGTFDALLKAPSIGKFFIDNVKKTAALKYQKLPDLKLREDAPKTPEAPKAPAPVVKD